LQPRTRIEMTNPKPCERCGRLAFDGSPVTVPADEYQVLQRKAAAYDASVGRVRSFRHLSRSTIARDPELAKFLVEASETMLLKDMRSAAVARFGSERVPSRSSIHRFLQLVSQRDREAFKRVC